VTLPAVLVAPGSLAAGRTVPLDDDEAHHLAVRRIPPGSPVEAFDGAGTTARATMVLTGTAVSLAIGPVTVTEPPPELVLAVGAGDRDRFVALAERCTELGVTTLVPLRTERTRGVESRVRDVTLDRARRRAREACKQARNPWAARVESPVDLEHLRGIAGVGRWLLADAAGGACPSIGSHEAVGWLVGPEGGFTEAERAFCTERLAARAVTFGRRILRFDTAAICAAVLSADRRSDVLEE